MSPSPHIQAVAIILTSLAVNCSMFDIFVRVLVGIAFSTVGHAYCVFVLMFWCWNKWVGENGACMKRQQYRMLREMARCESLVCELSEAKLHSYRALRKWPVPRSGMFL